MIGTRFIAPTPNCGHGGTTFTWFGLPRLWMCALCAASLGPLYLRCAGCGNYPSEGTTLVNVFRVGWLCIHCRRHYRVQRRFAH